MHIFNRWLHWSWRQQLLYSRHRWTFILVFGCWIYDIHFHSFIFASWWLSCPFRHIRWLSLDPILIHHHNNLGPNTTSSTSTTSTSCQSDGNIFINVGHSICCWRCLYSSFYATYLRSWRLALQRGAPIVLCLDCLVDIWLLPFWCDTAERITGNLSSDSLASR